MTAYFHSSFSTIPLALGEVHAWFAFPWEINDPHLLDKYYDLLSEEEKVKVRKYYFREDQHNCLITRALVRCVLSRYIDKKPQEWRFLKNRHGKPEILYNHDCFPLRFNVSHTDGLIACIISLENDVGIDVENANSRAVNLKIAERFFSPMEVTDLQAIPSHQRRRRFLDYWTLKEAYVKACGKGLKIPLNQFAFIFKDRQPIDILFDPRLRDASENWQFCCMRPTDVHSAAIAIRKNDLPPFNISTRSIVPLLSEELLTCRLN